jgi:hypothetical protein
MRDDHHCPNGEYREGGRWAPEDTSIAEVVREFAETAETDYEHRPGYFGSIEFDIVVRKPEQASRGLEDHAAGDTQPHSIH